MQKTDTLFELAAGQSTELKGGVCAYISRYILYSAFEKHAKPMIAKQYLHNTESKDTQVVAGVTVGVRKTEIKANIKLGHYEFQFLPDKVGKIKFTIFDEKVEGKIVVHVSKAANFIVNLGDLHNKDYDIDFTLTIRKLSSTVGIRTSPEGIP